MPLGKFLSTCLRSFLDLNLKPILLNQKLILSHEEKV